MEENQPTASREVRRAGTGTLAMAAVVVCLGALALGIWLRERSQMRAADAEHARTVASLNQALDQAKNQIQELNTRLDTLTQARPQPLGPPQPVRKTVTVHHRQPVPRPAAGDPRVDKLQGELADTQKELARTREQMAQAQQELDGKISSTRDDLNGSIAQTRDALAKSHDDLSGQIDSTRTDLSGSIAKTHDEVVALRKRGEQNIYEFQLAKAKQFQRVGPLSVALRSTSTKHKTYDLAMIVEDNQLSKKHINLYEPVWIRLSDRPQAVELVVNRVDKDRISGYLSEPKYKRSELAATSEKAPEKPQKLETR